MHGALQCFAELLQSQGKVGVTEGVSGDLTSHFKAGVFSRGAESVLENEVPGTKAELARLGLSV